MTSINFNCGEFRPGKEPVGGAVSSVVPTVVVGKPIGGPNEEPPGAEPPSYYKCVEQLILCPPNTRS